MKTGNEQSHPGVQGSKEKRSNRVPSFQDNILPVCKPVAHRDAQTQRAGSYPM